MYFQQTAFVIVVFYFSVTIFRGTVDSQILDFNKERPIKEALYLNNQSLFNTTREDCFWRPTNMVADCSDSDVKYFLYSGGKKEKINIQDISNFRQMPWDPLLENIFIIHGYAGGDDTLPIAVLRDAYINNGSFNVWMVDWGTLTQPPCYSAAVHNTRYVAKCVAGLLMALRTAGLRTEKTTCVGHSLGAHICGLISKNVLFRMHRIVGLDPARPLVPALQRLSSGDAAAVHVLHTNAGNYGETGRSGHVDFCINGGKSQPFCEETSSGSLCSHIWAVCYMAESINPILARKAEPCSRRCPAGPISGHRIGVPILMGQHTPLTATGSYCVTTTSPPYCPVSKGSPGDKRCCLSPST